MNEYISRNILYRLKLYITLCIKLLNDTSYRNKRKYYFLRYIVIALYRLILEYSKNKPEINMKCEISEIYRLGKEFLNGYYSIVDDNYILGVLRKVCPCIKESLIITKDTIY